MVFVLVGGEVGVDEVDEFLVQCHDFGCFDLIGITALIGVVVGRLLLMMTDGVPVCAVGSI